MEFYDTFLRLCNQVKKTPSRVILEVGGTKSAITRWKNGGMPTDATANKIADYFGVSVDYLMGREVPESKESPTTQTGSEALKEAGYYLLNDDNKKLIDQMIAQLIKSQSGD